MKLQAELPNHLNGRPIFSRVIPTVNNLTNLFKSLDNLDWSYHNLKSWEKPIYNAYKLEGIKASLKIASDQERIQLIKAHILQQDPARLGAHPICIYLVAYYLSLGNKSNISSFNDFVVNNGISNKLGSAQAIWSVGTNDGKYLGLFDKSYTSIDSDFFQAWSQVPSTGLTEKKK